MIDTNLMHSVVTHLTVFDPGLPIVGLGASEKEMVIDMERVHYSEIPELHTRLNKALALIGMRTPGVRFSEEGGEYYYSFPVVSL